MNKKCFICDIIFVPNFKLYHICSLCECLISKGITYKDIIREHNNTTKGYIYKSTHNNTTKGYIVLTSYEIFEKRSQYLLTTVDL